MSNTLNWTEEERNAYWAGMTGKQLDGSWYADETDIRREAEAIASAVCPHGTLWWPMHFHKALEELQSYPMRDALYPPLSLLALIDRARGRVDAWMDDAEQLEMFDLDYEAFLEAKKDREIVLQKVVGYKDEVDQYLAGEIEDLGW